MKKILYVFVIAILLGSLALIAFSPDALSTVTSAAMFGIIAAGVMFGIVPMISMYSGFSRGLSEIRNALSVQTSTVWYAIQKTNVFKQRVLDSLFDSYKGKVNLQYETGQMLIDIEDYINEEALGLRCWNNVISQIPGTLTGLGLLGTFIGLISGISGIAFSTVDATINSVETLLTGIRLAFYTSIAGVILSIAFNVVHRVAWNLTTRQLGVFLEEFHKYVIPTVEEQHRYNEQKNMAKIIERLDRIPKTPAFSMSNTNTWNDNVLQRNEKILMPQVIEAMKKEELSFVLLPKFDLFSGKMISAEALDRWEHQKLGTLSPAVYLPVLEKNGYITKLDLYTWEHVCKRIRKWLDEGLNPVPISINISKVDILSTNVAESLAGMIDKYKIPPRYIEAEIAMNAFTEATDAVIEEVKNIRNKGFKVILDGFNGDYVALSDVSNADIDEMKLDLRNLSNEKNAPAILSRAKEMHYTISAVGIETMEQVTMLKRNGCTQGQGYYYSKPVSQDAFSEILSTKEH